MPTPRQATPAQQFDTTLKKLFQKLPSRLIELVMGAQPLETVTIELPSVKQRRADIAYRLPDGSLHQFELQSDNDDEMILSLLRKAETIVVKEYRNMSLELNIEDSPFLHTIFLKGEKSGIKIGEKRGEKRGITLGGSRLLQIQLESRFGKLPRWALLQLRTADANKLVKWGEKVIEAKSLEEVIPNPRRARPRARR